MTPEKNISESELLQFSNLTRRIVVSEDAPIGSYIYTINIKPAPLQVLKNYHIIYTLSEGQRYFAANSATGFIFYRINLAFFKELFFFVELYLLN